MRPSEAEKDGQLIHVSVSISPIKDKQGRIIGASTIARDITAEVAARKEAEEKLAAASQYARSLIESSLDPLVTISADGKITDVNEATIKVTGVPRGAADRHRLLQLLHGAGEGPRRLPAGLRQGLRHRLSADDPPQGRPADGRALQRQRLQGHRAATCWASSPPPAT